MSYFNQEMIKSSIWCTLLLVTKFFMTIMLQGSSRVAAGSRPPEDELIFGTKAGKQSLDGSKKFKADDIKGVRAKKKEMRWLRLVQNDLENIPLGLITAWASVLCIQSSPGSPKENVMHNILFWAFTISRIAHSIVYSFQLQPHRALAWFVGVVATVGMCINALVVVW
jgi:uncharacterized MAPEG superfamily protein